MVANRASYPSSSSRVGVSWSDGVVRLRDDELFGTRLADLGVVFLRHVFALSEVGWMEIDCEQSTAAIGYDSGRLSLPEFLERLSAVLRGQLSAGRRDCRRLARSARSARCTPARFGSSGSARS